MKKRMSMDEYLAYLREESIRLQSELRCVRRAQSRATPHREPHHPDNQVFWLVEWQLGDGKWYQIGVTESRKSAYALSKRARFGKLDKHRVGKLVRA